MCWLLLLIASYAAGILAADHVGAARPLAHDSPLDSPTLSIALAGLGFVGLGALGLIASGRARRHGPWLLRGIGIATLVGLAFAAGHRGLERELARARRGALVAGQWIERPPADRAAPQLVDARVVARRRTGFGEEVELWDVRGLGGEGEGDRVGEGEALLPERLILSWSHGWDARGDPGSARPSRAERLLWPGARVRLGIRIEPLRPTRNPGSPDRERALARRGIGARARLVKPDWVVETIAEPALLARIQAGLVALRRGATERVGERLPKNLPGAALVRALAIGDRRDLSDETRRGFRDLGLAHLLSVSGIHIGFVALPAAAAAARLRALARPRSRPVLGFGTPIAVGSLVALGYAWLTGGSVPALRSGLLFGLFGMARAFGSFIAPGPALAAVGLGLLVADPSTLFDPGARFSFTACAALIAARLWGTSAASKERAPARIREGLLDPIRASLAVSIGLLPWVELEGLPRSLPSPFVNAIAIPWTGFVVLPCALFAGGLAWGLPEAHGDFVLGALLWPAAALEAAVQATAAQMSASWTGVDRPGWLPWSLGGALIGLGFVALRRGRVVAAALAWLVLGSLGLAPSRETRFASERPRLVFFDVGQADAALVETHDAAWLIDTGSGSEDGSGGGTLLRALRALSVDRLDGVILTHGDIDHRGGARRLLSALAIGELWLPALARPDPALVQLAGEARARGVRVVWTSAGDRRRAGAELELEVLWPPKPTPASRLEERGGARLRHDGLPSGRARNEGSLVVRATVAGRDVLFMADVGIGVEQRLGAQGLVSSAQVLKLGHHGSRQSSDSTFLAAVVPVLAIVSAPCDATRGLPSPLTLARVREAGIGLAWTGRDGAVAVVWTPEGQPRVATWGLNRECTG